MSYNHTYLLRGSSCGHDHLLWKYSQQHQFNFKPYYDAVQAASSDYANQTGSSLKTFPIVFHVLNDSSSFESLDLDIDYILNWVNHWFQGSEIQFSPVVVDPDGNEMTTPGLNIVDASNLQYTNSHHSGSPTYNYNVDGVALDHFEDISSTVPIKGIPLEYIQDNYSWDNTKYLNIIFVNKTRSGGVNSNNSSVVMTVGSNFLAENLNPTLMTGVIDLWALGKASNSYNMPATKEFNADAEYTDFGYSYNLTSPAATSTGVWGSIFSGDPVRARTVVHTLAHMLGVPHIRTRFGWQGDQINECIVAEGQAPNIYSQGILELGVTYTDPFLDTQNVFQGHLPMLYNTAYTKYYCDGENQQTYGGTHMHQNQFLTPPVSSMEAWPMDYYFTPEQISWMHGNCSYAVEDENGTYNLNILGNILLNASNVLEFTPDQCAPTKEPDLLVSPQEELSAEAIELNALLQLTNDILLSIGSTNAED
jgi:hypothetical protein